MLSRTVLHARWSVPVFLLAIAVISLGSAYIAEYGFGLKPCVLCLYQRIPYAVIGLIAILGLLLSHSIPCHRCLLFFSALTFLTGASIAGYHVGVEYHWWEGPGCGGGGLGATIDELKSIIMDAPSVRCDQPAFVFLGLSMAGWNFFYSLGLALLCILGDKALPRDGSTT